jgi:glycosyltransferase involved in cell wall biosynthesis
MIKVTLIIPIYNAGLYLEDCLNSAINQTLQEIEIICINDGSTDNSLDIVHRFVQKDKRIRVINQKNQGLSASRNNAIQISKGQYLAFLDSDDTLELNALELMYTEAKESESDIVVTQPKKIDKFGNITISSFPQLKQNHFENILNPNFSVSVCTKLFRRTLFDKYSIQFPVGYDYEDHITSLKLFFYTEKVSYLDVTVYNYFLRDNSITTSLSQKKIDDIFQVTKDMELFFIENALSYPNAILLKLIKLLSLYILVQLSHSQDKDLIQYFFNKLNHQKFFTSEGLKFVKQQMFGLYLDFLYKLCLLSKEYPLIEIKTVLKKIPVQEIEVFLKANGKNSGLQYAKIMINYLLKHHISSIVVYGAGQGFFDLLSLLDSENIEVKAVIDKNIDNLNSRIKDEFEVITLDGYNEILIEANVLVTSIAFCEEIVRNLNVYNHKYNMSLNTIDIKRVLEI